jgi:uncharacterized phosphatase
VTHLVLVRHGQTDWNLQGRIQGSSDIPLNETGRRQAREAGRQLADERWDAIVASPLIRAFETAQLIAAGIGLPNVEAIDDLRERAYGAAEGLTGREAEDRYHGSVPGRETREQVLERVHPALVRLAEERPGQSVLVVTHGGVIGTLVRHATEFAWPEPGQVIPNGSAHRFAYQDGTIGLIEFNGRPWEYDAALEVAEDASAG